MRRPSRTANSPMLRIRRLPAVLGCAGSLLLAAGLMAEEATPAPAAPDPTAAIVAEGQFRYRQRDLDAFLAIARRHAGNKLSRVEEDQIRQAMIAAFTARESLVQALALLPSNLSPQARDQLALDLLDFQGEPLPPQPLRPPTAATTSATPAPTTAPSAGPILVRLPQLALPRTLEGIGPRTLLLGLAFSFADEATATALQEQAPVIQDAILGYLHGLPPAEFAQPSQPALKEGLETAIRAKLPNFPANAVLVPELEVTVPDAAQPAR